MIDVKRVAKQVSDKAVELNAKPPMWLYVVMFVVIVGGFQMFAKW